jgi:hypothetical protein
VIATAMAMASVNPNPSGRSADEGGTSASFVFAALLQRRVWRGVAGAKLRDGRWTRVYIGPKPPWIGAAPRRL